MDRLRSHGFLAKGPKLLTHVLADLLYASFRDANARTQPRRAVLKRSLP